MMRWKEIAKDLRKIRKIKGIKVKDLCSDISISKDTYYRIENGVQEPNFTELQKILNYYEIEFIINLP